MDVGTNEGVDDGSVESEGDIGFLGEVVGEGVWNRGQPAFL